MDIFNTLEALMWVIPPVIAAVLTGCLFIPKFRMTCIQTAPRQLSEYLAYKLRFALYQVEEKPGKLFIRTGRTTAIELFIREKTGSTELVYQANATPLGWSVILLVFFLSVYQFYYLNIVAGIIAIAIILYMFYKEKQFIHRTVKPLLPSDGIIPQMQGTPSDEINTNLITGLSEGHRLATTAYEAELTSYRNRQALYFLGILPVGLILFTFVTFMQYGFTQQFLTIFPWMILCAFIFDAVLAVPILWYIRRQTLPYLHEYRTWSERLRKRLTAEVTKTSPEENTVSTFEFLTETSQEIPKWVDTIRRKGLSLDVSGQILFLFFRIEWAGLYFIMLVVPIIMMWNLTIGSLVGIIGIPLSIYYIYTYYRRWKHRLEQETTQTLATWNKKYKELRLKMERYLQDL